MVEAGPGLMDVGASGLRRSLLAASALSLVGIVALYLVAVRTSGGQRLDELAVVTHRYDRTTDPDSELYLRVGLGLLAAAGLAICWMARRRPALLAAIVVGVPTATVSANILRRLVLGRVDLIGQDSMNGASFPSGHTSAAVALGIALVLIGPRRSWLTFVAALGLAGSMGALVVLIPIHRPSDVVAANLLALATMCAAVALVPGAAAALTSRHPPLPSGRLAMVLGGGAAGWTGVWLGVATLAARRAGFTFAAFGSSFPAAVAVTVGCSAVVLGVVGGLVSSAPVSPAGPGAAA